jgi:hypothetical protein
VSDDFNYFNGDACPGCGQEPHVDGCGYDDLDGLIGADPNAHEHDWVNSACDGISYDCRTCGAPMPPETQGYHPDPRPIKTANAGTKMVRLSDVRGLVSKLIAHAKSNIAVAESEGRLDDADVQHVRRRAFGLVLTHLFDEVPVFLNPAPTSGIEARQGGNGVAGAVHESPAPHSGETPK